MFHAITSLLLLGSLSPMSVPERWSLPAGLLAISSPPPVSALSLPHGLSASGAIVMDLLSGQELFSLRADEVRSIASLAKLMTAIVILENHTLDERVTVPQSVTDIGGNTLGLLPGEQYVLGDVLAALLIASANDAAHTLANFHSGDSEAFVVEMNVRAQELGLRQTHFQNPMGFDNSEQGSTARELAWLAKYAWKHPIIQSLAARRSYAVSERSTGREFTFHNTNQLISSHSSSFVGLKTGTTELAKECLISLAYIADRPYIFVVLKSSDRYRDTLKLLRVVELAQV